MGFLANAIKRTLWNCSIFLFQKSKTTERAGAAAPAYVCRSAVQTQIKLKTGQPEFYKFRIFS